MNYERPQLLESLASAYALGVLRGRARRRFERLCEVSSAALAARQRWEDRFVALALELPPVAPSAGLWPKIAARIDGLGSQRVPTTRARMRPAWHLWVAAAALAVIALLVGKSTLWRPESWQPMALLAQANTEASWRLERSADFGRLAIHTIGPVAPGAARSYELWVLPRGAGRPVSLGLLPTRGEQERTLSSQQQRLLQVATQVAVSVEPLGGSPTGLPTGPIVIVATIGG